MSYEPTWKERLDDARPYVGPAVALLVVLAATGWIVRWRLSSAKRPSPPATNAAAESYQRALAASRGRDAAMVAEAESEPLRRKVDVARTLAVAARAREQWAEALRAYGEARAAQAELNQRFPGTRYADAAALDRFDAEIASLNAVDLTARVVALDRAARRLLQGRQIAPANEKIAEAAGLLAQIAGALPRERVADATLPSRLAYLAAKREELGAINDLVRERLAPAPGTATAQMLDSEVTQELYVRVMDANPSRHAGPALPVDSVSWAEAREFCQRLSWILGGRVRLPTEAEFRAAFGLDAPAAFSASAWAADNSDGESHDAGKSPRTSTGFGDLVGNLAEWLEPAAPNGETAPVAGGSYLDAAAALARVPIVATDKRERARHVGFRFVVEWPD